jgi:hypothetical protein
VLEGVVGAIDNGGLWVNFDGWVLLSNTGFLNLYLDEPDEDFWIWVFLWFLMTLKINRPINYPFFKLSELFPNIDLLPFGVNDVVWAKI